MRIASTAFEDGESIPTRFTCDGDDVSPPLSFSDVPAEAASLALIVDDPDAPGGTFVHWLAWNLPPDTEKLPEGGSRGGIDAIEGTNGFGSEGYGGPCPPGGEHRYRFHLYALDTRLDVGSGAERPALEAAMRGRVVEEARLVGLYRR